ncbi:MAG TPA: alpha/beta fold hydrolase [Longimicrobiaceae bacterium]|nr:alpha/beta fold hydrolase [Longimicrobiaceae bacterium]
MQTLTEHPRPAAGAAPRHSDAHLATGVRLRYLEQGDPGGHPVILLHGLSDSSLSYAHVLPLLPAHLHVYALDLRGHGDSERPDAGYGMRDLAADVVALMEAEGLPPATLVGHSLGSLVAQQVALAAPERIARLVLVGTGTTGRRIGDVEELDAAIAALTDPVDPEFVRGFQEGTIHRPLPEGFVDRAVAESLKLPARVWQRLMAGMLATEPPTGLRGRGIPILMLWGDHDTVFSRAEQDALLEMLPGAALRVYADTGHALHWERPAEFARDLLEFIGGSAAG